MAMARCVMMAVCSAEVGWLLILALCTPSAAAVPLDRAQGQEACNGNVHLQKSVNVSGSQSFFCQSDFLSGIPSWSINSTLYHWTRLPNDYSFYIDYAKEGYIFIIPVAKLWMNNTQFGCVNQKMSTMIGCLYVLFELNGPSNHHIVDNTIFVSCFNGLFTQYIFYIMWKINGIYYDNTRMPPGYIQIPNGLLVDANHLKNATVQCLVYSDLLWKQSFYYSEEVVILPVLGSDRITSAPLLQKKFLFNFNKFYFDNTSKTISWLPPDGCSPPVEYELIDWMRDSTNNITLNKTEYSIPTANISEGDHYFYLRAKSNGNICNISIVIYIPPSVITKTHYEINKFCISEEKETQLEQSYTWPCKPENKDICICTKIGIEDNACNDLSNTKYNVSANDTHICWDELDERSNSTVIVVISSSLLQYGKEQQDVNFTTFINETHLVIIETKPTSPVVISDGSGKNLCLTYNDTNQKIPPVTKYHINVTDATGLYFSFIQNKIDETTCEKLPANKQQLLNDECGNLTISVKSDNGVNLSDPFIFSINGGHEYNVCTCFENNVHVERDISVINTAVIITILNCTSKGYDNLSNAQFKISLISNTSNSEKHTKCSGNVSFSIDSAIERVFYTQRYNVLIQWISPNSEMCTIWNYTLSDEKNLYVILLSTLPPGGSVIICLFSIVIIGYCIFRNIKLKKKIDIELQERPSSRLPGEVDQNEGVQDNGAVQEQPSPRPPGEVDQNEGVQDGGALREQPSPRPPGEVDQSEGVQDGGAVREQPSPRPPGEVDQSEGVQNGGALRKQLSPRPPGEVDQSEGVQNGGAVPQNNAAVDGNDGAKAMLENGPNNGETSPEKKDKDSDSNCNEQIIDNSQGSNSDSTTKL